MSTGYQEEEEEYEDELYREDEGSLSSGAESEAEVWLYSQLHYSTGLGQREEEDDGEEGQRRGETGDEEGACPAAGRDPNTQRSPGQQWSSDRDSDPDPDSDGVESWMILDGEEQEGDCNILLNVEVWGSSSSSSSSSSNSSGRDTPTETIECTKLW
ncbi:hypothetical protein ANANG_G00137120 [Anguilla anguilla]|uniref:Uncharacterized protein n=1 Tax=Anguilla anguilla TaxID=7936 RepID=A0A9D3MA42_ANGAN|nr:hypothetical protein ANANG_G00137120 [Anguilla anguilla]